MVLEYLLSVRSVTDDREDVGVERARRGGGRCGIGGRTYRPGCPSELKLAAERRDHPG